MLSLGVLGIVELYNPGLVFPATLGGICLIIGLYGLQVLPVNWAGVLLMLLAAGFWAAEPFVMSHGALALAGAVSFVFGAPAVRPRWRHVPGLAAGGDRDRRIALFMAFAVAKVVQVRRQPVAVGTSSLVVTAGVVRHGGLVAVKGELWQAQSADGEPLTTGDEVVVEEVDGLAFVVRHAGGAGDRIGSRS